MYQQRPEATQKRPLNVTTQLTSSYTITNLKQHQESQWKIVDVSTKSSLEKLKADFVDTSILNSDQRGLDLRLFNLPKDDLSADFLYIQD